MPETVHKVFDILLIFQVTCEEFEDPFCISIAEAQSDNELTEVETVI